MWIKSHSITVPGLKPDQIWKVWADVNNRSQWDLDIEWAQLEGEFAKGSIIRFQPKGGPKLFMTITECVPNQCFVDCYKFPLARLYGIHEMEETNEGLKITTSIKVVGILGWLLRKIVAEKVAAEVPEQTAMLIKLAQKMG